MYLKRILEMFVPSPFKSSTKSFVEIFYPTRIISSWPDRGSRCFPDRRGRARLREKARGSTRADHANADTSSDSLPHAAS